MVKSVLRKVILGIMALMCILTLCFTMIGLRGFYSINGYDCLYYFGRYWMETIVGIGTIIEILMAVPVIIFACINIKKEKSAFKVLVFVFSMVIAGLYFIDGIIVVSIEGLTRDHETGFFVPLILQVVLMVGYIVINRCVPDNIGGAKTVPNAGYNPYAQPQYNNPNAGYNPYAQPQYVPPQQAPTQQPMPQQMQQPMPQQAPAQPIPQAPMPQVGANGVIYDLQGVRGRSMKVYEDKCVITTKVTFGSLMTGNASDGEKTIYYSDVLGVQFKLAKMQIGYLQLETASSSMNNRGSNFFNENSFTYDPGQVKETTNELMQQVADYIRSRVEFYKKQKNGGTTVAALSPAEELKKFKELLDMGVITQEEFDAKKKALLG